MNISIPIPIPIDMLNSSRGIMMSNSECSFNESAGNGSFMNYLLCHPETEHLLIPDPKYKNNGITQDCHNLELNLLLSTMLNESCNIQQINTYNPNPNIENLNHSRIAVSPVLKGDAALDSCDGCPTGLRAFKKTPISVFGYNEALAKVLKDDSFVIPTKVEIQPFQLAMNFMDSSFHGNDDFSNRPNISLQALFALQTQVTEGEIIDSKIMPDNKAEIKEIPKSMPELITKDLTKSPVPDTLIVDGLEITASNISGAKEIMNEPTNLRKGYETHMLHGSTNDNENNPPFSKGGDILNHTFLSRNIEVFSDEKSMPELITKDLTKSSVPDTLIVDNLKIKASKIFETEVFSDENQKASNSINHGKDGFNYGDKATEDGFGHMFGEHSQNKNSSVTSEVAAAARRTTDIPDNRFHITSRDLKSVEVSVEPEEIGRLDIKLSMDKDAVKAKITAFEHVGKEVMDRYIYNIVDSLTKDGINISGFSVSLKERRDNQSNSFNENKPEIAKYEEERQSGDGLTENSTISIFI